MQVVIICIYKKIFIKGRLPNSPYHSCFTRVGKRGNTDEQRHRRKMPRHARWSDK